MPFNVSDTGPAAYDLQKQQISQEQLQALVRTIMSIRQQRTQQNQWQQEQALAQQKFGLSQQEQAANAQYQTGRLGVEQQTADQTGKYQTGELNVRQDVERDAAIKWAQEHNLNIDKLAQTKLHDTATEATGKQSADAATTRAGAELIRAQNGPGSQAYKQDYRLLTDSLKELDKRESKIKWDREHPTDPLEVIRRASPGYQDPLAAQEQDIAEKRQHILGLRAGMPSSGGLLPDERATVAGYTSLASGGTGGPSGGGAIPKGIDPAYWDRLKKANPEQSDADLTAWYMKNKIGPANAQQIRMK